MMPGFILSTGNKMSPVWVKHGYRLISAVYKEILATRVLLKSLMKRIPTSTRTGHPQTRLNLPRTGKRQTGGYDPRLLASTVARFEPLWFKSEDAFRGKGLKNMP